MLVPQSPPSALKRVPVRPGAVVTWFRYSSPASTRPYSVTLVCAHAAGMSPPNNTATEILFLIALSDESRPGIHPIFISLSSTTDHRSIHFALLIMSGMLPLTSPIRDQLPGAG